MTDPQRYLHRVALFLLATLLLAGVVYDILWRAFLHNPALNGLILGVLLVGVGYSIRRILTLKAEMRWLEMVRTGRPGASLEKPPRLLAHVASVLGDREHQSGVLSTVSMRYLLDSLSARLDESRDISRYQTGLLIFLGLLGTFWGLLQTIDSVASVISGLKLSSNDLVTVFDDLKAGLAAPLSGMGTAFSSSLFGLAGSLVLGFVDLQANQAQNSFYDEVEEWLSGLVRHGEESAGRPLSGTVVPAGRPMPAYVHALLQQTAEHLARIDGLLAEGERHRSEMHRQTMAIAQTLSLLNERLQRDQELLAKLVEGQRVTNRYLAQREKEPVSLDAASQGHLRNIDLQLGRLAEELAVGREDVVRDLRDEIRLVARTVAIAAGEPQLARE